MKVSDFVSVLRVARALCATPLKIYKFSFMCEHHSTCEVLEIIKCVLKCVSVLEG
jgi:hypothetical protein